MHLGADLSLLSLNGEDWVMIASLYLKSNVKVGLKYVIFPKQKTENIILTAKQSAVQSPYAKQFTSKMKAKLTKFNWHFLPLALSVFLATFTSDLRGAH